MRSYSCLLLAVVVSSFASWTEAGPILLGSTNAGELVQIDVGTGTVTYLGQAQGPGWTDIAASSAGLFASSRALAEPATDGCNGFFAVGGCTHLYEIDPATGQIVQDIGSLGVAFVSDIDVASDGTMFGSYFFDELQFGQGGLVGIDPTTAGVAFPPNPLFGQGLENGGLAIDPTTGIVWGVESNYSSSPSLYQIDPTTGLAMNITPLGLGFGFDALEILSDGRFFATRAGGSSALYEIDAIGGTVALVPLVFDTPLAGNLNGLTAAPVPEPATGLLLVVGLFGIVARRSHGRGN